MANMNFLRLSKDFGNGSMDLTGLFDASSTSLLGSRDPSPQPPPMREQQQQHGGQSKSSQNNNNNKQSKSSSNGPLKFRKALSNSYSHSTNNPKNIGVISYEPFMGDMQLKNWISRFNTLPLSVQHERILKYEKNGQSCKIMNKPFHYNESDRAFRASMFTQIDMEQEHTSLVLATGKLWHELQAQKQQEIYNRVNSMAQQNRNILIRSLAIEQYYRNQLQNDIYNILDEYLNNINKYSDINKNNGKLKDNILRDIRNILKEFQDKYMQYSFKYIIKIELIERKDRRNGVINNKVERKKMRKHKNMGGFVTSSNCIWDNKNDDFIAIQWPKQMYYKPVRPIPKMPSMPSMPSMSNNARESLNEKELVKNVSKPEENVSNNDDNQDTSVMTGNDEDGPEDGNNNGDDDDNNKVGEVKNDEMDEEEREIAMKIKLREKLRCEISEDDKKWEESFLKPVYCLLSIWALKTYDYFDSNLPKFDNPDLNTAFGFGSNSPRKVNNGSNGNSNNDNGNLSPTKARAMNLGISNKDLKDDLQKHKHSRAVSFATEHKIVEEHSEEESDTPTENFDDDNIPSRNRAETVAVETDDEYEDA